MLYSGVGSSRPTRTSRRTDATRGRPRSGGSRGAKRSRRSGAPTLAAVLVLALLGGTLTFVAWRYATRPAEIRITATPSDSTVRFESKIATGSLVAKDLEPGTYVVAVSRKGFAPLKKNIVLERGDNERLSYSLKPANIKLALDIRPKTASFKIARSDAKVVTGKGPFSGTVPAGKTVVQVTAPGCRSIQRTLFVDSPTTVAEWLDPKGQLLSKVGVFECVPAPKGVAVTPDGKQVWVTALVTQPSIAAYNPRTGTVVGTVDLGKNGAVEVIFSKDGRRAYASQMQSASVYEIDTRTFKVLRSLKTESAWTKVVALSPDGKRLYAANWSGDDVSEIDLENGKLVRRMPTVDTPRGLWPTADGKRLFVAGFGENSYVGRLAVIDLKTGTSKTILEKRGSAMRHMVADETSGRLFTSDLGKDCVWVTDMKTLKTRRFVVTDRCPNTIDISPDGRVLFVSCRGANNPTSYNLRGPEWGTVLLFDTETGKPLDAIIGGNQCTALDLSDDGRMLVFSDFLDARLRVYEVPPYEVLERGKGGRYKAHFAEVVKPEWSGWKGPTGVASD